ncbi:SusD/RagB family nutrient-binding outer membrane lipoprotein [Sphingobacterium hungaricum]|uniref:SusD/RagB family nutrient-binding outer membrane lipoprotein n=1 Tax=Sphingobacterium hungaricum TaxID=2082723 RepID=A0A928UYB3_9SPHI|nr:SusD/RagB family nutrient-binding outer membrane lipoprotein [Sphingobacterium hungaricum]MBE8714258.1 SusD/RagB family nutrient-binding outer membrane lipoprotein [Sphingobacterium hungaricum]
MRKLKTISMLLGLFVITSCNQGFEEINTNPNGVEKVLPKNLLAPAITKVVGYNMSRSQRLTNELMQVTVNMGDGDGRIFRYEIRSSEGDYLWNNWYLQLTNFKDIYTYAEELDSKTYMGISLICQAWIFSMLTDTYGDIPYFNAIQSKENNFTPSFDLQSDIYKDLFVKLEEANTLLTNSTNIDGASDPIFAGNALLWRKFGNSLYLRLLMRVSQKSELGTAAIIKKLVDEQPTVYPVMANNTESAILRWSGSSPYVSPFATWRPADWYTPKLASFFVDNLNEWSDPRIQKWATLSDGEYAGIPSGYPLGDPPASKSTLPTSLMVEPLLGNILNYSELQFTLAEAAIKGYVSSTPAKTYYETGVTNAIQLWGYELPENYLLGEHVVWNEDASLDNKMELIFQQKYYALFFTDLQSWFEFRRTGYPKLPILSGHLNQGKMPVRLNYPVYIQSSNRENYRKAVEIQGADNINTLVWWQKP